MTKRTDQKHLNI